jgi:hypothetical protein
MIWCPASESHDVPDLRYTFGVSANLPQPVELSANLDAYEAKPEHEQLAASIQAARGPRALQAAAEGSG